MPDLAEDLDYFCSYVHDLVSPEGAWRLLPYAESHDKIPPRMEACRLIYLDILRNRFQMEKMRQQASNG